MILRAKPPRKKRPGTRRGQPTPAEKAEIRTRIYDRSGGRCELNLLPTCNRGVLPKDGHVMSRWHLVHLKSRGAGGSWEDSNLKGGCANCHLIGMHNPKPCPPKDRP